MKKIFSLFLLLPCLALSQELSLGNQAIQIAADSITTFLKAIVVPTYSQVIDVQMGSATLGPTAPTATTVGTFRGRGFDADNESVNFTFEVPSDWDGSSNMTLEIHWHSTSGDAIANTEDVKWDVTYRSIAEGEAVDNGTAVTITASFTGGASETDKEHYQTTMTIAYDNGNQPLTVEDDVGVQFDRDVAGESNSYSGMGIVYKIHLHYNSTGIPIGG